MFEQNTDILWLTFRTDIVSLLDRMVSGSVLRAYKVLKVTSNDGAVIKDDVEIICSCKQALGDVVTINQKYNLC